MDVILKTQKDLKSRQTKQLLYLPGIKDHLTYEEAAELIHNEAKLFAGTDYIFRNDSSGYEFSYDHQFALND